MIDHLVECHTEYWGFKILKLNNLEMRLSRVTTLQMRRRMPEKGHDLASVPQAAAGEDSSSSPSPHVPYSLPNCLIGTMDTFYFIYQCFPDNFKEKSRCPSSLIKN